MGLFDNTQKEVYGILGEYKKKKLPKDRAINKLNSLLEVKQNKSMVGKKRALNNEIFKAKRIIKGGLF